jgi:hypothetical protein
VGLLQIKAVFNLKYRQLEGFVTSILSIMALKLDVPSYTQVSRRAQQVDVQLSLPKSNGPLYIVFDSTGLKVYGEGEWKTRKHGISKRRTWRKLHLGVDEKTGMIHAQVLTENGEGDGDSQQFRDLLDQVESPVDRLSFELLKLMQDFTGYEPKMWGPSIIGFGCYHYKSDRSSQEGDWPLVGFSPRKAAISLYVYTGSPEHEHLLKNLGKFKMGKACIYIKKLSDIDQEELKNIMRASIDFLEQKYGGC